ncbi:MAG: MFS transporter [Streptosporangiales bacterium]|nr:MFS transporter [Streptosporangiales bacterium]
MASRAVTVPRTRSGSWWYAALSVCAVGWGANQFASLLPFYRLELAVGMPTVQATFGLYAAGLIPGLLVGGPISDRHGRRRVVLPALAISLAATVVLTLGLHGVGWLFVGRFVAGVASGAAFSAGTAWIKELSSAPYADAPDGAGARRATIAMTTGFGVGPLVAGVLAQWGPAPGVLPYVPHLVLAAVAVPLAWRTPETVITSASDQERGAVTAHRHPRFLRVVVPLAPWVFGGATIALAYLPGLVASRVHGLAMAFGGLASLVTAMAGVLVQPVARRIDRPGSRRLLVAALTTMTAGLLLAAVAATVRHPAAVLVAAVVLGVGYGGCMVCGLTEVTRLAAPRELGALTALFQAVTYLGFAAPFLLAALQAVAPPGVLLVAVAALALLTLVWTAREARRRPA